MINIVRFSLFAVLLGLGLGMHFHKDQDGTQPIVIARVLSEDLVAREHNTRRIKYGVPTLTWSKQLSDKALNCVKYLMKNNLEGKDHPCDPGSDNQGENIYRYDVGFTISESRRHDMFKRAMKSWDEEIENIDFSSDDWYNLQTNNPLKKVDNFIQLVWRSTTHVGCAIATSSKYTEVVCRYTPAGNAFTETQIRANIPRLIKTCKLPDDPPYCKHFHKCDRKFVKESCPRKCNTCKYVYETQREK
jgi:hypothetical protein